MMYEFVARFSRFVFLLLLAATLCGCHRRETPVEIGNRDQIFHLGNGSEPRDLDPKQLEMLQFLAAQVVQRLETRRGELLRDPAVD